MNQRITADTRSPVHVVYGGAHLFRADTPQKLGRIAIRTIEKYAPNFASFAAAFGLGSEETVSMAESEIKKIEDEYNRDRGALKVSDPSAWLAISVYQKTLHKLQAEPVEDIRIDFEDGYGLRPNEEEDAHALTSAAELAKALNGGEVTSFCGIRIKSLGSDSAERGLRTLDLFMRRLLELTDGRIPGNFVVTLPKVTDKREVKLLIAQLKVIEKQYGLDAGVIKIEIMVEAPQALFDRKGRPNLPRIVAAAKGRCTSAHFGAYDYTSSLGISADHQHLRHAACNFARQMMLIMLTPLDVRLSDSVTTELPVEKHRGNVLTEDEYVENRKAIHSAWKLHFANITNSMTDGFYQGWDLHPNQLIARYAAVYAFYLKSVDANAERLRAYVESGSRASLVGGTFDDAASVRGLLNYFRRGLSCGAFDAGEVSELTGLPADQVKQTLLL